MVGGVLFVGVGWRVWVSLVVVGLLFEWELRVGSLMVGAYVGFRGVVVVNGMDSEGHGVCWLGMACVGLVGGSWFAIRDGA